MNPTSPDVLALPTVADVLDLPAVRAGRPRVVAGSAGLERRVRWVHVAEIADIAALLCGGELVLTTGIALPDEPAELTAYIRDLSEAGVTGLVVELGRHWRDRLPDALVTAAGRHDLPLVALYEETRFVGVTEAVVALIRDAQLWELRATHRIHETFTALTTSGAEPAEVLGEVVRMTGLPAVLETMSHQVLAYDAAGSDPVALLSGWGERSRRVPQSGRTGYDPRSTWLTTVVGARGDDWGRLVLVSSEPPPHRHVVVAERAASALALNRLVTRDRESLERQAHRTLLTELLGGGGDSTDLAARACGAGLTINGELTGIAVRPRTAAAHAPALETQQLLRDLAEATAQAARGARLPALCGVVDDVTVLALVAVDGGDDAVVGRLAAEVRRAASSSPHPLPVVVAVGGTVGSIGAARRSLTEAAQVAEAALHGADDGRDYHRLDDVRLRGLLHLLRDDDRLVAFAERELAPIRSDDRLLAALRHYCEHGGNKSAAAAAAHLSRTAYYGQLARIEQLLGVTLDAPESLVSLHVALLAHDMRGGRPR
ncbi:purine catabolism regulator [Saccharopolyspora erythraea NRRL 2338]|uniref:Purine catabolism PurC-like protein n=2 Tax=Saccharopolyspora erythraea TaxID=1836 RepID=A4FF84_SACEN|nr:PucR family transcriptional regulator [Saccharopolyspora erythraea]EQD86022.1 CdaR family transcriptional regulator [Saccharopolyspora erythraea D]PFG96433.1 purine catabolism regulator [Saccharopolyspora erythraea NRRL 2338]QRK93615.1 PucR family transcriptional regulator [Saccharopolyspora erythraea]CAM02709.1 purine catabolism PurC-like protein [Saccharopolyspora erythraea NRRL 2338]